MPDDFAASTATTGRLSVGGSASGVIETPGDSDWFAITLVAGTTYQFSINGDPTTGGALPNLGWVQIHDSSGALLSSDAGQVQALSVFDFTAPSSGTYFVSAAGLNPSDVGPYQVWAKPFGSLPELADWLINGFWTWDHQTLGSPPARHWLHTDLTVNVAAMTAADQARALSDLTLYADVSGLKFTFVTGAADIDFSDATNEGVITDVDAANNAINAVHMRIGQGDLDPYRGYLHDLGHGFGLGHLGPYVGSNLGTKDTIFGNDSLRFSQMSAFGTFSAPVVTPGMADIYALQLLYGANNSTRLGDTVYGFNSTAGPIYDFAAYPAGVGFTIYDSGGNDTLDASKYTDAQRLDLRPGDFSSVGGLQANIAIYPTTIIENAIGGSGNDTLIGNEADNVLTGGAGNDSIDGGKGWDTAVFSGSSGSYSWRQAGDGSWSVTGPDGQDQLQHVEALKFTDRTVTLGPNTTADAVDLGYALILRETAPTATDQALHDLLSAQAGAAQITATQAVASIIRAAQNTSSVATMAYQFFTGSAPRAAGMDFLVSPTGPNANNLNSAYYQSFNIENRYINFAVNLGKLGAGATAFNATYGSLSLFDATKLAYGTIFGITPSDTKVHALLDPTVTLGGTTMTRADYFAYYGADGAGGIGTKAAMVGWLLAEAVLADKGTYALSNDAFLTDVALHGASFGVDIIGHYNQASFAFNGG